MVRNEMGYLRVSFYLNNYHCRVDNLDFRVLYDTFSDYDIRYYMYELLKALGIFFRNVILISFIYFINNQTTVTQME